MVQLKVLILAKLVITLLNNSCNSLCRPVSNRDIINIVQNKKTINDTIILSQKDYEIKYRDNYTLEIKIIDSLRIDEIKSMKRPIIEINIDGNIKIVKGNNILSSKIPKDCDYFYPLDINDNPLIINGFINLKQVSKVLK